MEKILSLGSIVKLKNGGQKLMIICRLPLYNNQGTIGYFDYAACAYPFGHDGRETYFFNQEDIEEVCFEGFTDEDEDKYIEVYNEAKGNIKYPRLQLQFLSEQE